MSVQRRDIVGRLSGEQPTVTPEQHRAAVVTVVDRYATDRLTLAETRELLEMLDLASTAREIHAERGASVRRSRTDPDSRLSATGQHPTTAYTGSQSLAHPAAGEIK